MEAIEHDAGFPGLRAFFVVPAPRERIWAVLLTIRTSRTCFLILTKCMSLSTMRRGPVEYWVDAMLRKYHYVVYRHYEKPGWRLTWRRLSGDLERIEGSWEVRETPRRGVHLLVYESYVQVGGVVPTSLVRWGARKRVKWANGCASGSNAGQRTRLHHVHGSPRAVRVPVRPRQFGGGSPWLCGRLLHGMPHPKRTIDRGCMKQRRRGELRPGESLFASAVYHQQRHDAPQDSPDKGRDMGELGQHDGISPGPYQQKIAEIVEGV